MQSRFKAFQLIKGKYERFSVHQKRLLQAGLSNLTNPLILQILARFSIKIIIHTNEYHINNTFIIYCRNQFNISRGSQSCTNRSHNAMFEPVQQTTEFG